MNFSCFLSYILLLEYFYNYDLNNYLREINENHWQDEVIEFFDNFKEPENVNKRNYKKFYYKILINLNFSSIRNLLGSKANNKFVIEENCKLTPLREKELLSKTKEIVEKLFNCLIECDYIKLDNLIKDKSTYIY